MLFGTSTHLIDPEIREMQARICVGTIPSSTLVHELPCHFDLNSVVEIDNKPLQLTAVLEIFANFMI